MTEVTVANLKAEEAMIRAQARAQLFVSKSTPTSPVLTASTEPSSPPAHVPHVKSSMKIKSALNCALNRSSSVPPRRKSVHFSSTNLCDIRQFKCTQRPSAVAKNNVEFFINDEGEQAVIDDDDDDDDDDDEDGDDDEPYQRSRSDYLSAALGLDEDEFDEDGISRVPKLRHPLRRSNRPGVVRGRDERRKPISSGKLRGWTMLTPGFTPYANVRVPGDKRPNVYLEHIQFSDEKMEIRATVHVRNLAFNKYVTIRYTVNGWKSFSEAQGTWSDDIRKFDRECNFDRFDVTIPLDVVSADVLNNSTVEMCVRYVVNGAEFWDNNDGKNYSVYLRNQKLSKQKQEPKPVLPKTKSAEVSSKPKETKPSPVKVAAKAAPVRKSPVFASFKIKPLPPQEPLESLSLFDRLKIGEMPQLGPISRGLIDDGVSGDGDAKNIVRSGSLNSISSIISGTTTGTSTGTTTANNNNNNNSMSRSSSSSSISSISSQRSYGDSSDSGTDNSSWGSESYRDFIQKYCFYTPNPIKPIEPRESAATVERK